MIQLPTIIQVVHVEGSGVTDVSTPPLSISQGSLLFVNTTIDNIHSVNPTDSLGTTYYPLYQWGTSANKMMATGHYILDPLDANPSVIVTGHQVNPGEIRLIVLELGGVKDLGMSHSVLVETSRNPHQTDDIVTSGKLPSLLLACYNRSWGPGESETASVSSPFTIDPNAISEGAVGTVGAVIAYTVVQDEGTYSATFTSTPDNQLDTVLCIISMLAKEDPRAFIAEAPLGHIDV